MYNHPTTDCLPCQGHSGMQIVQHISFITLPLNVLKKKKLFDVWARNIPNNCQRISFQTQILIKLRFEICVTYCVWQECLTCKFFCNEFSWEYCLVHCFVCPLITSPRMKNDIIRDSGHRQQTRSVKEYLRFGLLLKDEIVRWSKQSYNPYFPYFLLFFFKLFPFRLFSVYNPQQNHILHHSETFLHQ